MIDMHLNYDNMHQNRIFYALICINKCIISCYQDYKNLFLDYDDLCFNLFRKVSDVTFYAVVKTHKCQSNKIYKSELTIAKI